MAAVVVLVVQPGNETMGLELLRAGCLPVSANPARGSFVHVTPLPRVIASGSRPARDHAFVTPL